MSSKARLRVARTFASAFFLVACCAAAVEVMAKDSKAKEASAGRSRFAKLEGMSLHYTDAGRGSEALLFVHGWTCDHSFWRLQVPAFARSARVLAVDLPGHGRSDKPEGTAYTMDLFARAIEAVMRDARVSRAVLVGHSMGVPVVRQFYRKHPEKTLALVFVDGSLWPFAPRAVMEQFVAPMRADYRQAATNMVEGMVRSMKSAELREAVRSAMLATPQHVAISAMEGMMDESLWKEEQVKVPALAILARSPFWPADTEQRFKRLVPELDFRMWDGVSHFLMLDKPDEFNHELSDFLTRRKLLGRK